MEIIKTENLTKKFGETTAVNDVTLQVNKGEVFGLLGPNGAGKTTTMRMLCCLISNTSGSAMINGYDTSDKNDAMKIRKMIGIVHDNFGLYETLSAYDNLEFFGKMYEFPEKELRQNIEKYLKMLDIWEKRDAPVGSYSKGMKQKVAVVRALIHEPELLFLDEPTANLDPEASKTIRDIILELKKENRTIFLNTHNLDEVQRICDRVGVMRTKLIAMDTPSNLEAAIGKKITKFQLEEVNEKILDALRSGNPKSIASEGNEIILEMNNPEKETPSFVNAIVGAGGKIKAVIGTGASLEEVYLSLVRDK